MRMPREIGIRRVYDKPRPEDGARILVDRLWPRGLSKERAHLDEWCKDVAPSNKLRTWYAHDARRFDEFRARYLHELEDPERCAALEGLGHRVAEGRVTLLTATREVSDSHATVLADVLSGRHDR